MTDSTPNVVWDRVQQPFGVQYSLSGTATGNLRAPGQYFDSESGLNQNGFRDYDPTKGSYNESDPSGIRSTLNTQINLYGYSIQSPLRFIDPSGLYTVVVVNRNGLGHTGFYVSNPSGGVPSIYDPYGSYNPHDNAPSNINADRVDQLYPSRGSDGVISGDNL